MKPFTVSTLPTDPDARMEIIDEASPEKSVASPSQHTLAVPPLDLRPPADRPEPSPGALMAPVGPYGPVPTHPRPIGSPDPGCGPATPRITAVGAKAMAMTPSRLEITPETLHRMQMQIDQLSSALYNSELENERRMILGCVCFV